METLVTEKIKIYTTEEDENFTLIITGEIDMEDPSGIIRPYLNKLHNHILDHHIDQIRVNFKDVSFMNSNGVREFVHWFIKLNSTPPELKYHINIIYKRDVSWQNTSFPILQKLEPGLIHLQAE